MTKLWIPEITKGPEPLYQAIVFAIENDIKSGRLTAGSRMPTHRELAQGLGIALGTATRAYNEALKRGLLLSRGRQGTFVNDSLSGQTSFSRFMETDASNINLSVNYPCSSQDPDLASALRKISMHPECRRLLRYTPVSGLARHRVAAARWLADIGVKTGEESVILTNGAQHALMVTLAAIAKTGDIILADQYTYPGIKTLAEMRGLRLHGVAGDSGGMIPESIEEICRHRRITAVYCIPTLQNPTNSIMSEARRVRIAELAEKYQFLVIEDEINRSLVSDPPPLISSIIPDRCVLITSVSKVLASGLRVGFIVAPPDHRQAMLSMLGATTLMVSPLSFEIFAEWINDGTAAQTVASRIREAARRQKLAGGILDGSLITAHPHSYFIWLHLPEDWSSSRFAMEAYQRGISIAPAELFAVDQHLKMNAVRICLCAAESTERLKQALQTLAGLMKGSSLSTAVTV